MATLPYFILYLSPLNNFLKVPSISFKFNVWWKNISIVDSFLSSCFELSPLNEVLRQKTALLNNSFPFR